MKYLVKMRIGLPLVILCVLSLIVLSACTIASQVDNPASQNNDTSLTRANVSVTATSANRYPSATVDSDNDGQINYVLEPNLWNITSGSGQCIMTWNDSSGLTVDIAFTNVTLEDTNGWVHAYPEIWYGSKLWNNLGPALDGPVPLPKKLNELNNFTTTVTYSVTRPLADQPFNFPLETWLARDTTRNRTCTSTEIELMIWMDYYGLQGAGSQVGTFSTGGRDYTVWRKDQCGSGKWEYFAFMPTSASDSGTVTIDWGPFIREAMKYTTRSDWPNLYFTTVELGTEFGTPTHLAVNRLHWTVSQFTMSYGTGNILGSASSAASSSRSSAVSSAASSSRSSAVSSAVSSSRSSAVSSSRSSIASSAASSISGGYAVNYTVNNDWGVGATVTVTMKNNSAAAVNGWALVWTFAGNQVITQIWNATQTTSGATVTARNMSYNNVIAANGGTQNFGFNLSYSGSNAKPTAFTLNGTACSLY